MTKRVRIVSRISLVLYLIVVFALCFMNLSSMPDIGPTLFGIEIDKIAHFLMFLPLPALFYFSFDGKLAAVVGASVLAGLSLAGTTEWIQSFLTYRSMDLADFIADTIGLLCGAVLVGIAAIAFKKR